MVDERSDDELSVDERSDDEPADVERSDDAVDRPRGGTTAAVAAPAPRVALPTSGGTGRSAWATIPAPEAGSTPTAPPPPVAAPAGEPAFRSADTAWSSGSAAWVAAGAPAGAGTKPCPAPSSDR